MRLSGGRVYVTGGKVGRRTAEESRALLCPQAQNVIDKFGGARELARVLEDMCPEKALNASTIYRWMYPREAGGSGGEIPVQHIKLIMRAARYAGILLRTEDLYPHIFETSAASTVE